MIQVTQEQDRCLRVEVQSHRLQAVHPWEDLQTMSYQWMCDRASGFITKFLVSPPVGLSEAEAIAIAPGLRHFWPTIAAGDPQFDFSHLPAAIRQRLEPFNALDANGTPQTLDNQADLLWHR
ncbi:MAG: hypothetical protein LVS60_19075 [Nodosilinea sp. LVE1205-7]|jgi:hypothetical protein